MKKLTLTMFCILASIMCAKAQIGYQISLLNTATGEPRANETVTVTVNLSNSAGEVFYSETKSATTNDFGVLSLSIGNADTFKEVDLTKMPFFIEATANSVMIGKSQMLSVPVAEVAKQVAPMNEELLLGTWYGKDTYGQICTLTFKKDGHGEHVYYDELNDDYRSFQFQYKTIGQMVWIFRGTTYSEAMAFLYDKEMLYSIIGWVETYRIAPFYKRQ